MDLTDAIRDYVEKRLASVEKMAQSFEPAASVAVEVGKTTNHHKNGPYFRCEMTMAVPGSVLRADADKEDLYEAIDDVSRTLQQQLKNYKEKKQA